MSTIATGIKDGGDRENIMMTRLEIAICHYQWPDNDNCSRTAALNIIGDVISFASFVMVSWNAVLLVSYMVPSVFLVLTEVAQVHEFPHIFNVWYRLNIASSRNMTVGISLLLIAVLLALLNLSLLLMPNHIPDKKKIKDKPLSVIADFKP